jgi:periplasmic divalent cation tolerance protein
MTQMILVYITCKSEAEAKRIGRNLLVKKLCTCINVLPHVESLYYWPPHTGKFEAAKEVILLVKTIESKFEAVEAEVIRTHPSDCPCIFAIPVQHVTKKYYDWLVGEME